MTQKQFQVQDAAAVAGANVVRIPLAARRHDVSPEQALREAARIRLELLLAELLLHKAALRAARSGKKLDATLADETRQYWRPRFVAAARASAP